MMHSFSWSLPAEPIRLGDKEVHVWRAPLRGRTASILQKMRHTLSEDEHTRARRFRFEQHRDDFIVSRGLLRSVLSRYLGAAPEHLRFEYGRYGKPFLAGGFKNDGLRFNLAHSHELVLYAITRNREIGIDLEYIRRELEYLQVAERFFSPKEASFLREQPASKQPEVFFTGWTRKEAYIKAKGKGFSISLSEVDVSLTPGRPAELLSTGNDPQETSRWHLLDLEPGKDYLASLAVEGHDWYLKSWHWMG